MGQQGASLRLWYWLCAGQAQCVGRCSIQETGWVIFSEHLPGLEGSAIGRVLQGQEVLWGAGEHTCRWSLSCDGWGHLLQGPGGWRLLGFDIRARSIPGSLDISYKSWSHKAVRMSLFSRVICPRCGGIAWGSVSVEKGMHYLGAVWWGAWAYRLDLDRVSFFGRLIVPHVYPYLAELLPNGVEALSPGWPTVDRKWKIWSMVGRKIEGLHPVGCLIDKYYYILKKTTCHAMQGV